MVYSLYGIWRLKAPSAMGLRGVYMESISRASRVPSLGVATAGHDDEGMATGISGRGCELLRCALSYRNITRDGSTTISGWRCPGS